MKCSHCRHSQCLRRWRSTEKTPGTYASFPVLSASMQEAELGGIKLLADAPKTNPAQRHPDTHTIMRQDLHARGAPVGKAVLLPLTLTGISIGMKAGSRSQGSCCMSAATRVPDHRMHQAARPLQASAAGSAQRHRSPRPR